MTGPPGVGKSSLSAALIRVWRERGLRVGVLAVDPSSPVSGGALLGDRLRMKTAGDDDGVFVRSLSSRGEFGGLSAPAFSLAPIVLKTALFVHGPATLGPAPVAPWSKSALTRTQ